MDRHSGVNPFHSFEIRPGRGRDEQIGSRRAGGYSLSRKSKVEGTLHVPFY